MGYLGMKDGIPYFQDEFLEEILDIQEPEYGSNYPDFNDKKFQKELVSKTA